MSLSNLGPCVICCGLIPFLTNTIISKVFGCRTKPEDAATTMGNLIRKTATETFLQRN